VVSWDGERHQSIDRLIKEVEKYLEFLFNKNSLGTFYEAMNGARSQKEKVVKKLGGEVENEKLSNLTRDRR
jgi:hypothetical protein